MLVLFGSHKKSYSKTPVRVSTFTSVNLSFGNVG